MQLISFIFWMSVFYEGIGIYDYDDDSFNLLQDVSLRWIDSDSSQLSRLDISGGGASDGGGLIVIGQIKIFASLVAHLKLNQLSNGLC